MSVNIQAITDYVIENATELKAKMVAGETTAKHYSIQTGVKAPTAINIISTDALFQDGGKGFTPSGTTTLSNRILTPGDIKVQETIDPKEINKTYLSGIVKLGSYEDELPFAKIYTEIKLNAINKNIEKAIWNGDVDSTNDQLNKFDGFLKIIDAESKVVEGNTGGVTEINKENVVDVIDAMYAVLDTDALEADDLKLAMGFDVARLFIQAHKDLDMRNYDKIAGKFEFVIPGTNVTAFATSGLNGTFRMLLGSAENLSLIHI